MRQMHRLITPVLFAFMMMFPLLAHAADIDRFVGVYSGETEIVVE